MDEETKCASSKADFIRLAGIGTELAEFVIEFIEKPEIFFSMSLERRDEIENQMDAILSSFEQNEVWDGRERERNEKGCFPKGRASSIRTYPGGRR
jgi:hypothetical protein